MEVWNILLISLSFIVLYVHAVAAHRTNVRDISVCMGEAATVECRPDEFIITHTALFGRMQVGRCLKAEFGFLGCNNDVMFLVDRWCSGRQKCDSFSTPNPELDAANNECSGDLRAYMQISYSCVSVAHTGGYHCRNGETVSLTQPEGYISNHVTDTTGCGSRGAPWRIEAGAGQIIHISLIDFAALERRSEGISNHCHHTYAHIIEADVGVNKTVCGTNERTRRIYTSTTNVVEVHMTSLMRSRYLMHYEFSGCSDIIPPENAWFRREGVNAVIGCDETDIAWQLTCTGHTWQGEIGNCTGLLKAQITGVIWFNEFKVAIICAVVGLTTIVVAVGITLTVCFIRRRRRRTLQLPNPYEEGGGGRSGYATNPYYQPITFDHSNSEKESNSSDSLQRNRPLPGMSSAMAKNFMPIWQAPLPGRHTSGNQGNENNHNSRDPRIVTPRQERRHRHSSEKSTQRPNHRPAGQLLRAGSDKCACVKSANQKQGREKEENLKNEQIQKFAKSECEDILAKGHSRHSTDQLYCSLTKIAPKDQMLD